MSSIITVAQRKGGAGKSTLACQLSAAFAAFGHRVYGVDLDEQGSFSYWTQHRHAAKQLSSVDLISAGKFGLSTALWRARQEGNIIIIDTPPNVGKTVREAVRLADLVVTPLQLSPLDLDATMPTAALIGEEGRNPLFVVNRAPPRARIADKIRAELIHHGFPLAKSELGNRAAFAESLASGRGVIEAAPKSQAAKEIRALTDEIANKLNMCKAA